MMLAGRQTKARAPRILSRRCALIGLLSACRNSLTNVLRTCHRDQAQLVCLCPLTAWKQFGWPLMGPEPGRRISL